jgi:CHAD domain-containing protein
MKKEPARVATRRMRATLRVIEPFMDKGPVRTLTREVRSVTQALGGVRDLDVLIDNVQRFREQLTPDEQADMDGLLNDWRSNRAKARKALLRTLRSKEYATFKKRMKAFLKPQLPLTNTQNSNEVRHTAGSAIWARYEAVRTFEIIMDAPTIEQLHALRITGKYLRYTLECFRETLPPDAGQLIRDVMKMQDQLGALHDADVAAGLVRDYVVNSHKAALKRGEIEPRTPAGLAAYFNFLTSEAQRVLSDFSATWAYLSSRDWRLQLAQAIASL